MNINRLETHDRLLELKSKSNDISECCQDLINQCPFHPYKGPFYIFAHARTEDDGIKKRIIWQPRLTKPKAQTNSMLFKGYPGTDMIKIIWMIPARELWEQYKMGNITEHETVLISIENFKNNRAELEAKESDDLEDSSIDAIYAGISNDMRYKKRMTNLWIPKPMI
jgi:hypothetical protein